MANGENTDGTAAERPGVSRPALPVDDRWAVARGTLAGLGAFAAVYLVTYLVTALAVSGPFAETTPTWKLAGWYLHGAHFAPLSRHAVGDAAVVEDGAVDLLANTGGLTGWLYLVPPLVTAAVATAVCQVSDAVADVPSGLVVGAFLGTGYLFGALGTVLATPHVVGDGALAVAYGPVLDPAATLAYLTYPVTFGGAGGVLAGLRQ